MYFTSRITSSVTLVPVWFQGSAEETELVTVFNELRMNVDQKKLPMLVLSGFRAAVSTVDHNTPLDRLQQYVGLSDTVLTWFRS